MGSRFRSYNEVDLFYTWEQVVIKTCGFQIHTFLSWQYDVCMHVDWEVWRQNLGPGRNGVVNTTDLEGPSTGNKFLGWCGATMYNGQSQNLNYWAVIHAWSCHRIGGEHLEVLRTKWSRLSKFIASAVTTSFHFLWHPATPWAAVWLWAQSY